MNPVLESIREVVDNSQFVTVDRDQLRIFCESYPNEQAHWMNSVPFRFEVLDDKFELAFSFVFNSVNFSYWGNPKWSISYQEKQLDGAWAMIASLRRAHEEGKTIFDPNYLAELSYEDAQDIFRGNIEIPLLRERVDCLRELGQVVRDEFNSDFTKVINRVKKDALRFLELLTTEFPSFNDSVVYHGHVVQFQKRAQLAISDIFEHFKGKGFGEFNNIDELSAFADYKIPQILRASGILVYNESLAHKVDNRIEISAGSQEEIEIRANMIWAIELMRKELCKRRKITASEIDHYLWLQGQKQTPNQKPYHLTRTTCY